MVSNRIRMNCGELPILASMTTSSLQIGQWPLFSLCKYTVQAMHKTWLHLRLRKTLDGFRIENPSKHIEIKIQDIRDLPNWPPDYR